MDSNRKPEIDEAWFRELFEEDRERVIARAQPPEAGIVYWRAIQAERRERRRKAMRPIVWVERIAWLAIAAVVALAAGLLAPSISWNGLHTGVEFPALAPVTAAVMLGLSLLLLVGWLVWNEE